MVHLNPNDYPDSSDAIFISSSANLYESTRLIEIQDEIQKIWNGPFIKTIAFNDKVSIAIENNVKVFVHSKENCNLLRDYVFASKVDTLCATNDGILLCLSSGHVKYLNINDNSHINIDFLVEKSDVEKTFVECFWCVDNSFVVVTAKGKILSLKHEGREKQFVVSTVAELNSHITIANINGSDLLVSGEDTFYVNSSTKEVNPIELHNELVKVMPFKNRFIGLLKTGLLIDIYYDTLGKIFPKSYNVFYNDFCFVTDDSCESHMIGLIDDGVGKQIILFTYPGCDTIFTADIQCSTIQILPVIHKNEYLITIHNKNDTISLHKIYKTDPENRLQKLIALKDFTAAETFAKTYNLDVTNIKKAKVENIIDQADYTEENLNTFLALLDEIDDALFTLKSCYHVQFSCGSVFDVKRVVEFGCSKIRPKSLSKEESASLYSLLMNVSIRLNIFQLLTAYDENVDIVSWNKFSRCSLMKKVICELKKFHMEECIIIYNHFHNKCLVTITENYVATILQILNKMSIKSYESFLYTFVPITLKQLPSSLTQFSNWLINKTEDLERESEQYPENAIRFVKIFLQLFTSTGSIDNKQFMRIMSRLDVLQDLDTLKSNFSISIPIKEASKGPSHFCKAICDVNMDENLFTDLLQNFLQEYMLKHNLNCDDVLLEKVESIKHDESNWPKILPFLLNTITSVDNKMKALLTIVKNSSIPWSQMLQNLCNDTLNHHNSYELQLHIGSLPLLTILQKYDLTHLQLDYDFDTIIRIILKRNIPTMVEDITSLCIAEECRHTARRLLLTHLVEKGKVHKVIEVIDGLSGKDVVESCQFLANYITIGFKYNYDRQDTQLYKNFREILHPLFRRIISHSPNIDDFHVNLLKTQETLLLSACVLRETYKRTFNFADFQKKQYRKELLDEILSETVESTNTFEEAIETCGQLSLIHHQPRDAVLIEFCSKIYDFHAIYRIAEDLYSTSDNSRHLCLATVLLLRSIGATSFNNTDMTMCNLNETFDPNAVCSDKDVFVDAFRLAERLTAKACLAANGDELGACVRVMEWAATGFFIRKEGVGGMYRDLNPSAHVFDAFKTIFGMFVSFVGVGMGGDFRFLTHFDGYIQKLTEEELYEEIQFLPETMKNLCSQGQYLSAYKLITTLNSALFCINNIDPKVTAELKKLLKSSTAILARQVFLSKNIDTDLAYYLLLTMDEIESVKIISHFLQTYKRKVSKFSTVAKLGMKFLDTLGIKKGRSKLEDIGLRCKWWKKFGDCNITYEDFFQMTYEKLLEKYLHSEDCRVDIMEEFCEDFKLNLQKHYILHLKLLLVNWKPKYTVEMDLNKKKSLVMHKTWNELFDCCKTLIEKIEDKSIALETLQKLLPQISFYHYEVFICFINLMEYLEHNIQEHQIWLRLIEILENYKRISVPNQTEISEWYASFPFTQNLDPLSEWRFPFSQTFFTADVYNLIRTELTLETYKQWFDVVDFLEDHLSRDNICVLVVKEMVASGAFKNDSLSSDWQIDSKYVRVLKEVEECLDCVVDLEKATSAIYHLMNALPEGADKVEAAKLCYSYSLLYKDSSQSPQVQKVFLKIHSKYYSLATLQILHSHNLAQEQYLKLATNPGELINALYSDERISNGNPNLPSINDAVDEIGKLHSLDVFQIKCNLIERFLSNTTATSDLSCLNVFDVKSVDSDADLLRVNYICSNTDKDFWQRHLIESIDVNKDTNFQQKARTLKCLVDISTDSEIEDLTGVCKDNVLMQIEQLLLLSDLECLGFNFDLESLAAVKKTKLLTKLSQNLASNLKVMASICMIYDIYDLRYWEIIVKKAIELNLITELKQYAEFLRHTPNCYHQHFYINAWQIITDKQLEKIQFSTTMNQSEIHEMCLDYVRTIQSCPVWPDLKFKKAIEKFLEINMPQFAAILLQYPNNAKEKLAKQILSSDKNVVEALVQLKSCGVYGLNPIITYLNELRF